MNDTKIPIISNRLTLAPLHCKHIDNKIGYNDVTKEALKVDYKKVVDVNYFYDKI